MSFKHCTDVKCQRDIPEAIFEVPTSHSLGCSVRRSLAQKVAYEEKQKRIARARKAAATRAARKAGES